MKEGQLISVKDSEGNFLKRRVVVVVGNLVFVCKDEEYRLASQQKREPIAVGWPKEAVFIEKITEL